MKLLKSCVVVSCVVLFSAMPLFAARTDSACAILRTTINGGGAWVDSGVHKGVSGAAPANYVQLNTTTKYQTMLGIGGCFQERMYDAMQVLSAAGQDSVIRAIFDTSGANFSYCRYPIGCCDFDDNAAPYSLDDNNGNADYSMTNFSIARDSTKKLKLVWAAQKYQPNLKIWASPWSPPRWMKSNNAYNDGTFNATAANETAYALYLSKAVQAFAKAGMNITYITCQNEPDQNSQNYPTCGWTAAQEIDFYQNYMIGQFNTAGLSCRIIAGVWCCTDYTSNLTGNATINNFIGAGSHSYENLGSETGWWNTYGNNKPFIETESNYGTLPPGSNAEGWTQGTDQWNTLQNFINNRAQVVEAWNIVNDQTAQSGWGWAQEVAITINSGTHAVTYNPYYYAYKHFGHYMKPGAINIGVTNNSGNTSITQSCGFLNPDSTLFFVFQNTGAATTLVIRDSGITNLGAASTLLNYTLHVPGNSFNTIVVYPQGLLGTPVSVLPGGTQMKKLVENSLSNVWLVKSTLSFSLPQETNAREMDIALIDLLGRTVWSGHRAGSEIVAGQQSFAIRPGLRSGSYILTARVKDAAGNVATASSKVAAVN
ncbi:MAG: glycoside hydrolase family 30 beta sandwich domain-containing protein [Chitinispirillaceae bacterium]|jgi:glucosylceramidase